MAVRTITVVVDNREKRPIRFPEYIRRCGDLLKIKTAERHLRTGDYRLDNKGFLKALIERKGRETELYDCTLGRRHKQFRAQLERLSRESDRPVLLLDTTPYLVEMYDYTKYNSRAPKNAGELVIQNLVDLCMEYNVNLIWFGRMDSPMREHCAGRLVLYLLTTKIPQAA